MLGRLFYQQMTYDNYVKNIIFKIQKSEAVPERCSSNKVLCKYAANLQGSKHAEALFQ